MPSVTQYESVFFCELHHQSLQGQSDYGRTWQLSQYSCQERMWGLVSVTWISSFGPSTDHGVGALLVHSWDLFSHLWNAGFAASLWKFLLI